MAVSQTSYDLVYAEAAAALSVAESPVSIDLNMSIRTALLNVNPR
jgi:hypothetical protein